jgi:hypothetical protein
MLSGRIPVNAIIIVTIIIIGAAIEIELFINFSFT